MPPRTLLIALAFLLAASGLAAQPVLATPEPTPAVAESPTPPLEVEAEPATPEDAPTPEPPPAATPELPTAAPGPSPDPSPEPAPSPQASPAPKKTDPCGARVASDEPRLDQFRRELFETICEAAAKFDSFFGNRRFDEEARRSHGRAGLRLLWDEEDGTELDGDLDVNIDFPNLDHRLNAFLGRQDRDRFVSGTENTLDFLPDFFGREGDEEWLLGLGYRPVSSDRSSLDFDVGADIGSKFDPFVRTRYRHYWLIGAENLVRARQTVYYSEEKRLGSGTRLDFERPVGRRTLARWSGNVVFDDTTEGGDWDTGVTVFHGFTPDRAIAWYVGVSGESKREVPIEDYGTTVTYRQRMFRRWFFGEVITGVTWPRDSLLEQREPAFHLGFGFQIQFSGDELGAGRRAEAQ